MPKVFISYSHDSSEHAARVLALADRLIQDGLDCILDQYEGNPPEGWPLWMDRQIEQADYVLIICTETYHKRVMGKEQAGIGRGVKWESVLTYTHIYTNDSLNTKFIPVLFAPGDFCHIPRPLQDTTYYCLDSEEGYEQLYWRLTDQHKATKPVTGQIRQRSQIERNVALPPEKILLSKLPTTESGLFGREEELTLLDNAWTDPHTHIVSIVAWGGVGKTALVNEWLNRMGRDNYRSAERVYGWSFYSQGTREDRQISAEPFIFHALSWFGDPDPTQGSPWDKGGRLAGLIRQHRTLLILDGVEPLQYPPGEMQGRLRDQGLQALLKELARSQSGLCIMTTRVAVKDLEHATKSSVKRILLEHLSPEAGVKLLETLGVKGTAFELQETAQEFNGHALALNLLGRYLAVVHDGDIRKRDLIPHLSEEEGQGGHARRVMESYESWLSGTPELNILYMMGLFDRPVKQGAIEALLQNDLFKTFLRIPAIKGLTDNLHNCSDKRWKYAVRRLQDLRLISQRNEGEAGQLSCHPLVQQFFDEKLKQKNLKAWKKAHHRLYKYYKNLPEKELPDTLEEMEPLFAAVVHGCKAEQYRETLDNVYWKRIRRKNADFAGRRLGIFETELALLSNFFEIPREAVKAELPDKSKAFVFSLTGFRLMTTGRLREAIQPFQKALTIEEGIEAWKNVAEDSGNLSELYLHLGDLERAKNFAVKSVKSAERLDDWLQQLTSRTWLANILLQTGEFPESEELFYEAEDILKSNRPKLDFLYSLQGFWFCDLLSSQKKYQKIVERASYALNIARENNLSLYTIALDNLSLGCVFRDIANNSQEGQERNLLLSKAESFLDQAVEGLREARVQHLLSRSLIARTALHRIWQNFPQAWNDLSEAQEIALRGEIKLYLADYQMEASRLCLTEGRHEDARQHLNTAKTMINEMGYHRRDKEVEELAAALNDTEL